MRPTLFSFEIFGVDFRFHAYTVALAVAFLAGILLAVRANYRRENPYPITPIGGLWIFFPAIFFSKVYWYLQYDPASVWRSVILWEGGLVFYGGLFGGVLGAVLYLRWNGVPILPVGDIVIPYLPLAHGIARLGCFLNGCCWGMPSALPWAVTYPQNSLVFRRQVEDGLVTRADAFPLPVHPSQLYESAVLFGLFFLLRYCSTLPHRTGALLLAYPAFYGAGRFFLEFFRGDVGRGWLALTTSQFVALGLVAFGLCALAWLYLRPADPPREAPPEQP